MKSFVYLAVAALFTRCSGAEPILLRNEKIEVTVRPDIGRVISICRPGEPNRFWVADDPKEFGAQSPCYGGLRIMISPQRLWSQLRSPGRSDPAVDGGTWSVTEQDENHVKMTTFSEDLGVQVSWDISLLPDKAAVAMDYEVLRTRENPFPLHLWSVANAPAGGDVYLSWMPHVPNMVYHNCLRTPQMDQHVEPYPEFRAVQYLPKDRSVPMKIGTYGRWIAQVRGQSALVMCEAPPSRMPYFENSNLQVFSLVGKLPFYELEYTSPLYALRPGESFRVHEVWGILDLPDGKPAQLELIQSFADSVNK